MHSCCQLISVFGGLAMNFNVGDYVVCPGHGVGQIFDIEVCSVGELEKKFYRINILGNGLKVLIPTDSEDGVRSLVEAKEIDEVFQLLGNHEIKVDNSTWNRRYREYSEKIKSGLATRNCRCSSLSFPS